MITWIVPLVGGIFGLFVLTKLLSESGIRSKRFLGVTMLVALAVTFLISNVDNVLQMMNVFGMHITSIWLAGITILLSIKETSKMKTTGLIFGLGVVIPLACIYFGLGQFYWMNWIAIFVAAVMLMFGSDHLRTREHLDIGPAKLIGGAVLIIVTTIALWLGTMGLGQEIFSNQYIISVFSVLGFLMIETYLVLMVRRSYSNSDAIVMAMEFAGLDLVLSYFLAVMLWA